MRRREPSRPLRHIGGRAVFLVALVAAGLFGDAALLHGRIVDHCELCGAQAFDFVAQPCGFLEVQIGRRFAHQPIIILKVFDQNLDAGPPDPQQINHRGHPGFFPLAGALHIPQRVEGLIDPLADRTQFFQRADRDIPDRRLSHRINERIHGAGVQKLVEHQRRRHLRRRIRMLQHGTQRNDGRRDGPD